MIATTTTATVMDLLLQSSTSTSSSVSSLLECGAEPRPLTASPVGLFTFRSALLRSWLGVTEPSVADSIITFETSSVAASSLIFVLATGGALTSSVSSCDVSSASTLKAAARGLSIEGLCGAAATGARGARSWCPGCLPLLQPRWVAMNLKVTLTSSSITG